MKVNKSSIRYNSHGVICCQFPHQPFHMPCQWSHNHPSLLLICWNTWISFGQLHFCFLLRVLDQNVNLLFRGESSNPFLEMLLKIWLNLQHQIWYCVWEYDDGVLAAILLQNWKDFLVWEELFHMCKSGCWNENLTTLCQGEDSLTHWIDQGLQVWTMTMRKCRAAVAS